MPTTGDKERSMLLSSMLRWGLRLIVLAYALFFSCLGLMAWHDNLEQGYPAIFTWASFAAYVLIFIGILLYVSGRSFPRMALLYRAVLPLAIAMFLLGLWMDSAGVPLLSGLTLEVTLLVLPAYWANYRFAFKARRRKERPIDHSVFD
jgi:ATP/ADP translocase